MNFSMKKPAYELSAAEYELLNSCIAWHIRPHREVFLKGLAGISKSLRFHNLNVLELGATARSTLCPFLVARGAKATVACYSEDEIDKIAAILSQLSRRFGLARERFHVTQADIFDLDQPAKFDLILLKDVLGGVNRQHDQEQFRRAVRSCLSILHPNGRLLIIDKARSFKVIHIILKKLGSAGRNNWHYFTRDEIERLIPNGFCKTSFAAHGILSFGDFGGGLLQMVADFLDEHIVEKIVPVQKRVVFQLMCAATAKANNQAWDESFGASSSAQNSATKKRPQKNYK